MDEGFDTAFRTERMASQGPSHVATRAGTMLNIVSIAVDELAGADVERVMHAFLDVVVFGRSITLVMQNLRSWEPDGFNAWYAPWEQTMATDQLLQFFNKLRREVIHGYMPQFGVAMTVWGRSDVTPGQVVVHDFPLPETHLDEPIQDKSTLNLCRLYYRFLDAMFTSFAPLVWEIQDRVTAEYRGR